MPKLAISLELIEGEERYDYILGDGGIVLRTEDTGSEIEDDNDRGQVVGPGEIDALRTFLGYATQ